MSHGRNALYAAGRCVPRRGYEFSVKNEPTVVALSRFRLLRKKHENWHNRQQQMPSLRRLPIMVASMSETNLRFFASDAAGSHAPMPEKRRFVESWIAVKDNLVSMKVGLMEPRHWMEAQFLINALRTNPNLGDDVVPKRVEYMFDMMDRLSDELEFMNSGKNHHQYATKLPRLVKSTLTTILLAWRDHITGALSKTDIMYRKKQRRSRASWNVNAAAIIQNKLDTASVLEKVKRYMDLGLCDSSTVPFSVILNVMNQVDDPLTAPYKAHEIYLELLEKSNHNPLDTCFHPNQAIVYAMIEIWACSWLPESSNRVDEYLMSLQRWHQQTKREDLRPHANMFCSVMEAHSRSNEPRAAFESIKRLIDEMERTCPLEDLDTKVYNRICHAFSGCNLLVAAEAARKILDDMCQALTDKNSNMPRPDRYTFNSVISAFGQLGRTDDAMTVFERMERLAKTEEKDPPRPDMVTYSSLIWAFAKGGNTKQAESFMHRLMAEIDQGSIISSHDGSTDHVAWEGVLMAWAKSRDPKASEYVARLIQRLIKFSQEQHQMHNLISTSTLNILLECYSVQATQEAAHLASNFLGWMDLQDNENLKPNGYSYMHLISAWCNANKPEIGGKVLRQLCNLSADGKSSIEQHHFNVVIDAWAKSNDPQAVARASDVFELMKKMNLQPDIVSYTSLILSWSRSTASLDPFEHVERLLGEMLQRWKEGDAFARPDEKFCNAVITALGRSDHAAALDRAEAFFHQIMRDFNIKPNYMMYNSLMSGWMRHKRPDKVEELFQEMKLQSQKAGNLSLQPHFKSHVTRLQSWSNAGNPEKAAEALHDWILAGEKGASDIIMPTTQAFNAVLVAWLRSDRTDAADKAKRGLQQMKEYASSGRFDCYPGTIAFTTVISAYARAESPHAGQEAMRLFHELKDMAQNSYNPGNFHPNLITYMKVIEALIRSKDSDGERNIRMLLQELQATKAFLWTPRDDRLAHGMLRNVRRLIELSQLESRSELLWELDRLESLALLGRSNHRRTRQQARY